MFGILTDYSDTSFSLNDFALFANLFYGWFNLHSITPTLSLLLCTPSDTAFGKVVNRYLNGYSVTGQYSYIVNSELSRNMSCYDMLVGKLYLEGGIRQRLYYRTFKFNNIILCQNNPSSALYL